MKTIASRWTVALAAFLLVGAGSSRASVVLNFSQLSSDETPASALKATATFTVSGSQLLIDINNQSAYDIAQLYFNTDTALTDLSFATAVNPQWSIDGTGTSQSLGADGMGSFNYVIDFGSGADRLDPGSTTQLVLDMTGTTTEATIGSKLSVNPPGDRTALGVIKFESGPKGDSAFGGSTSSPPPPPPVHEVPAPATLVFAALSCGIGSLSYAMRSLRQRRKKA
jgi:hypothetical protein